MFSENVHKYTKTKVIPDTVDFSQTFLNWLLIGP